MRRLRLLCPLLRLHILLLLAQHRSPTEIADWLLCSRSLVYEVAACWRQGWRPGRIQEAGEVRSVVILAPAPGAVCWRCLASRLWPMVGVARAGAAPPWP